MGGGTIGRSKTFGLLLGFGDASLGGATLTCGKALGIALGRGSQEDAEVEGLAVEFALGRLAAGADCSDSSVSWKWKARMYLREGQR